MAYRQTIAIAQNLLADGRVADVAHMLAPLVQSHPPEQPVAEAIPLLLLEAQLQLLYHANPEKAYHILKSIRNSAHYRSLSSILRYETELWWGWLLAWPDAACFNPSQALLLLQELSASPPTRLRPTLQAWLTLGIARAYASLDEYALLHHLLQEPPAAVRYHAFIKRWYHSRLAISGTHQAGPPSHRDFNTIRTCLG